MHEIHAPAFSGARGARGRAPVQGDVLAPPDAHATDTDAIPEAHYRLEQHPAYLELLERMRELDPPEIYSG